MIIEIQCYYLLAKCIEKTAEFPNSSSLASSINFMTSDKNNDDKHPGPSCSKHR